MKYRFFSLFIFVGCAIVAYTYVHIYHVKPLFINTHIKTIKVVVKETKNVDLLACFKYDPGSIPTIEEISNVHPRKGKSIFFHETSCKSRDVGKVTLNIRQACAIESAARANPSMDVYVLIAAPAIIKNEGTREDKILQMLMSYSNINIKHMYLDGYVTNTPVEELFRSGKIETSKFVIAHLSDVLRYTTLWKYGGIYLDLDVFVIKSLENLEPNFSALEFFNAIAAGAMGFEPEGKGHEIVEACMKEVNRNYIPNVWAHNSIGILTEILQKICNTTKVVDMKSDRCQGFKLYKPSEFYPISYPEHRKLFEHKYLMEARERIKEAYAIHLWNKLSANLPLTFNNNKSTTIIEEVAIKHCPNVYKLCESKFQ